LSNINLFWFENTDEDDESVTSSKNQLIRINGLKQGDEIDEPDQDLMIFTMKYYSSAFKRALAIFGSSGVVNAGSCVEK